MYEDMLSGSEIQPLVLQLKINGVWEWNKIHMLRVDSDSMVGFFETTINKWHRTENSRKWIIKPDMTCTDRCLNREAFRKEVEAYLEQEKENTSDYVLCFDRIISKKSMIRWVI